MTDPYMLGVGSIYGIVNAPLPHNLIPTTHVLQPYCNRADTRWYTLDKRTLPIHRNPHKQAENRTHQYGLERAQANS
jgi:hypothetical protein